MRILKFLGGFLSATIVLNLFSKIAEANINLNLFKDDYLLIPFVLGVIISWYDSKHLKLEGFRHYGLGIIWGVIFFILGFLLHYLIK